MLMKTVKNSLQTCICIKYARPTIVARSIRATSKDGLGQNLAHSCLEPQKQTRKAQNIEFFIIAIRYCVVCRERQKTHEQLLCAHFHWILYLGTFRSIWNMFDFFCFFFSGQVFTTVNNNRCCHRAENSTRSV